MIKINDQDLLTDTPFVAIDLDVLDNNINKMGQLAKEAGLKFRPHTKTHKSVYIAQKQIDAGAVGINVATLGEAEAMADGGIVDIVIAFPISGKRKLDRLSRLLERANIIVGFDDIAVAKGINAVGEEHQKKSPVYIDVDTGLGRMGREPKESIPHIL